MIQKQKYCKLRTEIWLSWYPDHLKNHYYEKYYKSRKFIFFFKYPVWLFSRRVCISPILSKKQCVLKKKYTYQKRYRNIIQVRYAFFKSELQDSGIVIHLKVICYKRLWMVEWYAVYYTIKWPKSIMVKTGMS